MTLRHMKIFITVCDCGGITAAGEQLYLSQPSVSQAVAELEQYYGVRLFDRISRKLFLTESGKRMLYYARHILSLFDDMENEMRDWDAIGTLRVGCSLTIATCLLPGYSKKFSQNYPHIKLQVSVDNSQMIERRVLENSVDFALIEGVIHSKQIVTEPLMEDEMVLVCGREHPLWGVRSVEVQALPQYDFILRERGSGTRELFDSALLTLGLVIQPAWDCINTQAIIEAVAAGLGISVLPRRLVEQDIQEGRLWVVEIEELRFQRNFSLIYHASKYLPQSAKAFIEICRESRSEG